MTDLIFRAAWTDKIEIDGKSREFHLDISTQSNII